MLTTFEINTAFSQHRPLLWVHGNRAQQVTLLPLPIQHPHKVITTVTVCHVVSTDQQLITIRPETTTIEIIVDWHQLFQNRDHLLQNLLQRFQRNAACEHQLAALITPLPINPDLTQRWANRVAQLMMQHGLQLPYRGFDNAQSQVRAIQPILPIIQAGLTHGQTPSTIARVINHLDNLQSLLHVADSYLETDTDCRLANILHRLYPNADHYEFSRTLIQITQLIFKTDPALAQQLRQ